MGGWGEGFFSFFFGPQCVPQQNITMCSFSLPPIKTPRTPPPPPPPPPPPLHEKNKIHGPPNHAFFGKEKSAPKSPHPPSKSQKYLPQHPTIPHPKVDIFNFLDCPPIEASLGLSALSTYIKESVCVRPSVRYPIGWKTQGNGYHSVSGKITQCDGYHSVSGKQGPSVQWVNSWVGCENFR